MKRSESYICATVIACCLATAVSVRRQGVTVDQQALVKQLMSYNQHLAQEVTQLKEEIEAAKTATSTGSVTNQDLDDEDAIEHEQMPNPYAAIAAGKGYLEKVCCLKKTPSCVGGGCVKETLG